MTQETGTFMEYYSALLVFGMESSNEPLFRKKLESIIILEARDFSDAHARAIQIGTRRANDESVRNAKGRVEIKLTFCYVKTLDVIGEALEGREIWSKLNDVSKLPRVNLGKIPTQTI